jgi:hypothetical protein
MDSRGIYDGYAKSVICPPSSQSCGIEIDKRAAAEIQRGLFYVREPLLVAERCIHDAEGVFAGDVKRLTALNGG